MVIKKFLLLGLAAEYWIEISVDVIDNAADHQMFTTLTGELSWQRLRRSAVDFYSKKRKKLLFEPPFLDLGVTYALHLWLVGKPVIDFIFIELNFFAIFYGWDVISRNLLKSAYLEGGSIWVQISEGREHRPPTTVGVKVAEWLPFRAVSKYPQCII